MRNYSYRQSAIPITTLVLFTAITLGQVALAASGKQKTLMTEYQDEKTSAQVRNLTPGMPQAQVIYQTHPMWTQDLAFFVFTGEKDGRTLPYARDMKTGEIHAIVENPIGSSVLDARKCRLFYFKDRDLFATPVGACAEPKHIASLPENAANVCGGISLDATGEEVYVGVATKTEGQWSLMAVEIISAKWRKVTDLEFQVGHVQANPHVLRLVMFCHETGGDAPQRTWVIEPGANAPRPFYKETYDEWVTHEVWWGPDRAAFTIFPYDDAHKEQPHGLATVDLKTGTPKIHSQFVAWHTHGSPDGRWLVADDFDRNIWLIDAQTDERRLLTQGHLGKGFKTHPHPSFTPDSKAVVFTSSKIGVEQVFQATLPNWESLPLP